MDVDTVLSVVVALVCLAGIGMTAATMESAVETTPDDVIDVPASSVPLGPGEIREYKERLQGGPREGEADDGGDAGEETTAVPSGETTSRPAAEAGDGDAPDQRDGGEEQRRQVTTRREAPGPGPGEGSGPADPSLLDRLLAFLRWLLATALALLPVLLGLGLVALAVANRDRLSSLFDTAGEGGTDAPVAAGDPDPRNDVTAAWYEMVSRAGVERPETKTPRQCASAAVAAGADREAVKSLTRVFEEVRYGGAQVTADRRRRAREALAHVSTTGGDR